MRGRLNFARALLNRPEVLFLDEPTAGLDPVSSRRIRDLIREQRDTGATVFLTTHDMAVGRMNFAIAWRFSWTGGIRLVDRAARG